MTKPSLYYFYLARCSDGSLYAGITNDLTKREARHNHGTGAKYTAKRRPIVIVFSEQHTSKSEAAKREREVKRWSRKRKIRLILESPMAKSIQTLARELEQPKKHQEKPLT